MLPVPDATNSRLDLQMRADEIRTRFLQYFARNGHQEPQDSHPRFNGPAFCRLIKSLKSHWKLSGAGSSRTDAIR